MTVLDVGAGPGIASRDLARLLGPLGKVIAIDQSDRFLTRIRETAPEPGAAAVDAVSADVQELSLNVSADGAYARWLLHFTPDPRAVLAGVHAALKPGAAFAIQDYVNWPGIIWMPTGGGLELLRESVKRSYRAVGADAWVGQRLPGLLDEVGFEVTEVRSLSVTARPWEPLWQWPTSYFRSYIPRMVAAGHMTEADQKLILDEWEALTDNPAAVFISPPQVEIIAHKRA